MKRAQIQQVFIYIMTMVIIALVLIVGYRSINKLMDKGCDTEVVKFETNIKNYISKYSSYGSLHKETMNTPCAYEQICFADTETIREEDDNIREGFTFSDNPVIELSVQGGIEDNIFLVKGDKTISIGFMEEVKVDSRAICIKNTNGQFRITFEGLGKSTKITSGTS